MKPYTLQVVNRRSQLIVLSVVVGNGGVDEQKAWGVVMSYVADHVRSQPSLELELVLRVVELRS